MQPIPVLKYTLYAVKRNFSVLLISSILIIITLISVVTVKSQSAEEGQSIFLAKCAACHTIGAGALVGPDLQGVTNRRETDWLERWILEPDVVLAEGDPIATQLLGESNNIPMPNLALTETEVAALIIYLETQTGEVAQTDEVVETPVEVAQTDEIAGDPVVGKDLFTGAIRFENDGPPCMGCHRIAGIGILGGGVLGPDLSETFNSSFKDAGIDAFGAYIDGILSNPLETMNPIFGEDERPLTSQEQADVKAFILQATVSERSFEAIEELSLLAVAGAAILMALAHFSWRNRLIGVRKPLVKRSKLNF